MGLWILRDDNERFVCNVRLPEMPQREVRTAYFPTLDSQHGIDSFASIPMHTTTFYKQMLYGGWSTNIPVTRVSDPEFIARKLSDELVQAFRRHTKRGNEDELHSLLYVHAYATLDHAKMPCCFTLRWVLREPYVTADGPIPVDMIVAGLEPDPMPHITISHTIEA